MYATWITPTAADVLPQQAELDIVKEVLLPDGKTGDQLLAEEIAQAVNDARGFLKTAVRKGYLSAMGPEGTIPPGLLQVLAIIVRTGAIARVPGLESFQSSVREDQLEEAQRRFRDVASGAFMVDPPAPDEISPIAVTTATAEVLRSTCRQATRERMSGL